MKNRIFLFALAVFSLFITVNLGTQKTLAQRPPVYTDCDPCLATQWSATVYTYTTFSVNHDCWVEVGYRYKTCPSPGTLTLDIVSVRVMAGSNCLTLAAEDYMQAAIKKVLYESYLYAGTYPWSVHLISPSCVEKVTASGAYQYYIVTCNPNFCCQADYEMTLVEGQVQMDNFSNINKNNTSNCEFPQGPGVVKICKSFCSEMGGIVEDIPLDPEFGLGFPSCSECTTNWTSSPSYVYETTLYSTCKLKAFYQRRVCDDVEEFYFYKVELSSTCSTYTKNEVVNRSIEGILSQLGLVGHVRMYSPSCWTNAGNFYVGCDQDECCKVDYYLEAYSGGVHHETDPIVTEPNPTTCYGTCEYICEDPTVTDFAHDPFQKRSEKFSNTQKVSRTFIVPNPTKGATSLHYVSEYTGELSISITDNLGNIAFQYKTEKNNIEFIYHFDTENLAKGAYHYRISTGLIPLSAGSFIID